VWREAPVDKDNSLRGILARSTENWDTLHSPDLRSSERDRPLSERPDWTIRPGLLADVPVLHLMIYEALYWQDGMQREPIEVVLAHDEIMRYFEAWGRPGDAAIIATTGSDAVPIGAAWYRLFTTDRPGYGFIDCATPEVAIAVAQENRRQGAGRALMNALIAHARESRLPGLSLSVEIANTHALGLYQQLGFEPVGGDEHNHTMLLRLDGSG
jgi:GNAT superfamily N-acetyltransferase